MNPAKAKSVGMVPPFTNFSPSYKPALRIKGAPAKKEYLAASSLFSPTSNPAEMVIALLEVPGIKAKA